MRHGEQTVAPFVGYRDKHLSRQSRTRSGIPLCRGCGKAISKRRRGWQDDQFHSDACAANFAHAIVAFLEAGGSLVGRDRWMDELPQRVGKLANQGGGA